jgi:hypothetical protein
MASTPVLGPSRLLRPSGGCNGRHGYRRQGKGENSRSDSHFATPSPPRIRQGLKFEITHRDRCTGFLSHVLRILSPLLRIALKIWITWAVYTLLPDRQLSATSKHEFVKMPEVCAIFGGRKGKSDLVSGFH